MRVRGFATFLDSFATFLELEDTFVHLTGLIEREGSKKTGQYIIKKVDCAPDSCQVCAKSPLCTQFRQVSE